MERKVLAIILIVISGVGCAQDKEAETILDGLSAQADDPAVSECGQKVANALDEHLRDSSDSGTTRVLMTLGSESPEWRIVRKLYPKLVTLSVRRGMEEATRAVASDIEEECKAAYGQVSESPSLSSEGNRLSTPPFESETEVGDTEERDLNEWGPSLMSSAVDGLQSEVSAKSGKPVRNLDCRWPNSVKAGVTVGCEAAFQDDSTANIELKIVDDEGNYSWKFAS